MMDGSARAAAISQAVLSHNPNASRLSPAETQAFTQALAVAMNADVSYLTSAVQVLPGTLASPVGQAVSVAGPAGPEAGSTTAPGPVTGVGSIA